MLITVSILQIITIIGILFILKALMSLEKRLTNLEGFISDYFRNNPLEEKSIGSKLMDGMDNIKSNDDKHLNLLYMSRQLQYLPSNLTPKEKEVLQIS